MSAQILPLRCPCSQEIADVVAGLLVVDPSKRPTMPRVAELLAPRCVSSMRAFHVLIQAVALRDSKPLTLPKAIELDHTTRLALTRLLYSAYLVG